MKIEEKLNFLKKKNEFFKKFQNPPKKKMKKSRFFSKKNENSFSIKITSIGRKIILKLYSKSYESTVSAFEALNAPKSFLYVFLDAQIHF